MGIPEGVAINMRHSTKHQAACCSYDCEIFTIQMAQAMGHEITGTLTSSSPLSWNEQAITAARRMVEAGFPVSTVDGCVLGGTGPATVAGSLVISLAEHMAMIVLVQLVNPGQRMIIGHFALAMNMKSGAPAFGMITSSLSNVAFNQMCAPLRAARWQRLPRLHQRKEDRLSGRLREGDPGAVVVALGWKHHSAASGRIQRDDSPPRAGHPG